MKKLPMIITIFFLLTGQLWAVDYYACQNAQNVTGDTTWCTYANLESVTPAACTKAGAGSYTTWATVVANSPTLYANGCASVVVNDSFTAVSIKSTDGGAGANDFAGGSFTLDLSSVKGKTITANIVAGSDHCLVVSGAADAGTQLTIVGAITGSGTTNTKHGVSDAHTGATSVVVIQGAITGGTNGDARGYNHSGSSGYFTITGNATGSGGGGFSTATFTAGTTITGNCTGSDTGSYSGCTAGGAGGITVTGNIVNGLRGTGVSGTIGWNPTAASGHYMAYMFGTDVFVGPLTCSGSCTDEIATGTYYILQADGTRTQGTKTGGGGGVWAY